MTVVVFEWVWVILSERDHMLELPEKFLIIIHGLFSAYEKSLKVRKR